MDGSKSPENNISVCQSIKTATTMDSAVNGFAVSGIMPFDDVKFEKGLDLADKHTHVIQVDPLRVVADAIVSDGNDTDDDGVNNTEDRVIVHIVIVYTPSTLLTHYDIECIDLQDIVCSDIRFLFQS